MHAPIPLPLLPHPLNTLHEITKEPPQATGYKEGAEGAFYTSIEIMGPSFQ
jgi:hypothetical protein